MPILDAATRMHAARGRVPNHLHQNCMWLLYVLLSYLSRTID